MRIGIIANASDSFGYGRWNEKTYEKLKTHGFHCTDYDMADTNSFIYTASQSEVDKMLLYEKELASKAGVEIYQVHGPWRWPAYDFTEEDRAERMEKMKKSIRATAMLGCKNWVIHPIMPYGVEEFQTEDAQKTWDMNISFMSELLKTAKKYDVTICLENMPFKKFSLSKPDMILKFVKTIDDENFKICLDTGHVAVFDDLNLADEVRKMGKEIRVLHVHDNKFGQDLHLMPYFGVIDWKEFAVALKDINFDGSFSIEAILPGALSDDIFEDMCISLSKIAKTIVACL